jgi:3-hydroxyisobutyrate dehydrogenase-like beta-hydroxyacid dehydrogenase
LSVGPPHGALDVARDVAGTGFRGVYVDANAISVATAAQVAGVVLEGGASYVDGGIIGPPPEIVGHTRLYLSGARAEEVRVLFGRSALDARIADGQPFAASAVKMAYAAWTKGTSALLLACRALARAEGVERTLLAEWALSQPALGAQSERSASSAAAKGWRWVAEMEEIAGSMEAAGLPPGFHQAAADIFDRAAHAEAPGAPGLAGVGAAGTNGPGRSPVPGGEAQNGTLNAVLSALI